jgi:hypothetical protein
MDERKIFVLVLLLAAVRAWAHDPLMDLPAPNSVAEAWNVIRQSVGNIPKCLESNQIREVTAHVANCSPAYRVLQADAKGKGDQGLVDQIEALYASGDAIIVATREEDDAVGKARRALAAHEALLKAVMSRYGAEQLDAEVYNCPMHPLERSIDPKTPCPKCSMKLIRRRIPASTTYEKPGEPSMKLAARTAAPLKAGERAEVTVRLVRNDGVPVTRRDLLTMHTEKIHLLIVDRSLADYHHEHPKAGEKPGEYVFSFTPNLPGPYRIFADVVPAETSVQEYVIADLAAETKPKGPIDRTTTLRGEADGFWFTLKFDGPLVANQPIGGELSVTAPDGVAYKQLQPVMGAFAHLVAFHEDGKTVLHIHPEGPEPATKEERGGPVLRFKLYAPVAGYYRLYAQTQIMDEAKFAPFNITVRAAK